MSDVNSTEKKDGTHLLKTAGLFDKVFNNKPVDDVAHLEKYLFNRGWHITHTDSDGVGCALAAYYIFIKTIWEEIRFVGVNDAADTIEQMLSEVKNEKDLPDFILISDLSIPPERVKTIMTNYPNIQLLLVDHHPTNELARYYSWAFVNKSGVKSAAEIIWRDLTTYEEIRESCKNVRNVTSEQIEVLDKIITCISRYDTWMWKTDPDKEFTDSLVPYLHNQSEKALASEDLLQTVIRILGPQNVYDELQTNLGVLKAHSKVFCICDSIQQDNKTNDDYKKLYPEYFEKLYLRQEMKWTRSAKNINKDFRMFLLNPVTDKDYEDVLYPTAMVLLKDDFFNRRADLILTDIFRQFDQIRPQWSCGIVVGVDPNNGHFEMRTVTNCRPCGVRLINSTTDDIRDPKRFCRAVKQSRAHYPYRHYIKHSTEPGTMPVPSFSAGRFCKEVFGGGGHDTAAGATLPPGILMELMTAFMSVMPTLAEEYDMRNLPIITLSGDELEYF